MNRCGILHTHTVATFYDVGLRIQDFAWSARGLGMASTYDIQLSSLNARNNVKRCGILHTQKPQSML